MPNLRGFNFGPPGGSDFFRANEPAGMTMIDQLSCDTTAEHASPHVPPWDLNGSASIFSDATAPHSPPNVLRYTYPLGWAPGSAPGNKGVDWSAMGLNTRQLYIWYLSRMSPAWQMEDSGFTKQMYAWVGGAARFFMAANGAPWPDLTSPITPYSMLQAVTVFPGGQGNWAPNLVPSTRLVRNQWHGIEYVLTANSDSTADGSVEMYVDGVHCTSVTGIQWTPLASTWTIFTWDAVWGGNGSTNVQSEQYLDFDGVYLSGKS